jgi:hypothetical protein
MSYGSLIGYKMINRYKKSVSCASKTSSPSVLSHDTKKSKISEKDNPFDFYPKNFNHAFYPNLNLKDTVSFQRRDLNKIRVV